MSTATTTITRTGSCLCGGVKVTLQGEPVSTNLCHCTSCQKFSGNVFASIGFFKIEQITFTESEPELIKTYEDRTPESGNLLLRRFCSRCGSPLSGQRTNTPDAVAMPVGIFDGDKTLFKPSNEYFCRGRADWVAPVEGATDFETLPPR